MKTEKSKDSEDEAASGWESRLRKPHDHFFRDSFVERRVALGAIQEFLPKTVYELAQPENYELIKESFLDEKLLERISDVLLAVPLKNKGTAYLYFLFEHQRKTRKLMPYRLRQLEHGIFDYHLRTRKTGLLPLISKVVFYNGKEKWRESTNFSDMFEVPAALAEELMSAPYTLADLSRFEDSELKVATCWAIFKMAMKHINDPDISTFIGDLILKMGQVGLDQSGLRFFEAVFRYLFSAGDAQGNSQKLFNRLKLIDEPLLKEKAMTIAEQLLQEGIQEGIAKGEQKKAGEIALNLLKLGCDFSFIEKSTGLSFQQITELKGKTH